jgi:hypothetical protein
MWEAFDAVDLFCFTANANVTNRGALVMGAGMARQVLQRFPGIDLQFGEQLLYLANTEKHYQLRYGLLFHPLPWEECGEGPDGQFQDGRGKVVAFQTKYHWYNDAQVGVIVHAANMLWVMATAAPQMTIALNFPGVGHGNLPLRDVMDGIEHLPDNVHVYHLGGLA